LVLDDGADDLIVLVTEQAPALTKLEAMLGFEGVLGSLVVNAAMGVHRIIGCAAMCLALHLAALNRAEVLFHLGNAEPGTEGCGIGLGHVLLVMLPVASHAK
jgi:hypothetical protein